MFARSLACAGFVSALTAATPMSAEAGGLFGDGGVFRGTVGNWIDKHVEQPILTPAARATAVVTATAGAVALGGAVAAPIGVVVGNGINDSFAGGAREPAPATQQQQVAMGATCANDVVGTFPLGGSAPLGSQCTIKLQNGKELGGKVVQ